MDIDELFAPIFEVLREARSEAKRGTIEQAAALLRDNNYWVEEIPPIIAGQSWCATGEDVSITSILVQGDVEWITTFVGASEDLGWTLEVVTFNRQSFIDWARRTGARPEVIAT